MESGLAVSWSISSAFGKHAEPECFNASDGLVASRTVSHGAGNLGNLGDPAAIGFLLGLDGERHEKMIA